MTVSEEQLAAFCVNAQIALKPEEVPLVLGPLNDLLALCDKLQELDCRGVEPFYWRMGRKPSRRPDEEEPWADRDRFIEEAPTQDGDFFRVPRIMAESKEA